MPARLLAFLIPAFALLMTQGCDSQAAARCFPPEATLPTRAETQADPSLGASARDLAAALFDRDWEKAGALLTRDPALAKVKVGRDHDMLAVALATCDPAAVTLLLRHGAPADGDGRGIPLGLALMANDPAFAHALLSAGASPTPPANPLGPFRTAIAAGSIGGVRMLLDFKASPNVADRLGHDPLLIALDMERFRIAEVLLEAGANPWAVDNTGGNLWTAAHTPMVTRDAAEADAQRRLQMRLVRLGWPNPAPSPPQIRALAKEGKWPPANAKAPPLPPELIRAMAEVR